MNRKDAETRGSRPLTDEAFVLPSRRTALELGRSLLQCDTLPASTIGPILLTGDAGVGKTWLCRRLEAEAPAQVRWISVDLSPSNRPVDLYRLISHELGLVDSSDESSRRLELLDFLTDRLADGRHYHLVIDEAQNLALPVWEEVKILANRLNRPGGFSRMVLVGQSILARRFTTRPFAAMEARLGAKIHLGPIDADEAAELVNHYGPGRAWSVAEVDALHRDSAGNPRQILRRLGPITVPRRDLPVPKVVTTTVAKTTPAELAPAPLVPGPLTGPDKPPIRVDENMIEVGWSPEETSTAAEADETEALASAALVGSAGGEEAVHDHYAALQAWREWTENQARMAVPPTAPVAARLGSVDTDDVDYPDETEDDLDELPALMSDRSRVRVEGEQKFAPFGQLFSRMAQSHDSE